MKTRLRKHSQIPIVNTEKIKKTFRAHKSEYEM